MVRWYQGRNSAGQVKPRAPGRYPHPMFRRGKTSAQSAADADRQALFEKLAQRPETVCPFLGLAGSRADYEVKATDDHRCYAFGDPEAVSAEYQRNVCLQRGYANCPRYLRGVLVIPTDELEALRRPPQRVPPPPPPPPPQPRPTPASGGGNRRRAVAGLLVVLLLIGGAGAWWMLAGPGGVAQETPTPRPSISETPSPSAEPSVASAGPSASVAPTPITAISGTADFALVGAATREGAALRLTPSAFDQVGAVWYPELVPLAGGFSAEYTFQLGSPQAGGGDGLAFVVQTQGPAAVGGLGGDLGYGGLPNSLAVEVDTFLNEWPAADDPNANHVSVHTGGAAPNNGDEGWSIATATNVPNLSDGGAHLIRIDYDPGTLAVSVDGTLVLSVALDLAGRLSLEPGGTAYVGFTAATGTSAQTHGVLTLEMTFR